jgi:hypothetical protein
MRREFSFERELDFHSVDLSFGVNLICPRKRHDSSRASLAKSHHDEMEGSVSLGMRIGR